jgi:hypothetical protein
MKKIKGKKITANAKPKQSRHGPEPERLKISGDWVAAIDTALEKKRPPEGWPK